MMPLGSTTYDDGMTEPRLPMLFGGVYTRDRFLIPSLSWKALPSSTFSEMSTVNHFSFVNTGATFWSHATSSFLHGPHHDAPTVTNVQLPVPTVTALPPVSVPLMAGMCSPTL